MATELKNTLFSFTTLRSPGLVSDTDKRLGFVFHPEMDETYEHLITGATTFFKDLMVSPRDTPVEQLGALKTKVSSFPTSTLLIRKTGTTTTAFTLEKYVGTAFYNFSNTVARTRKSSLISKIAMPATPSGVSVLPQEKEVVLWDNLFYQVVTQQNPGLRDAIIHVLITNHYLTNPTLATQLKTVKASVVIPPSFFATSAEAALETRSDIKNKEKGISLSKLKDFKKSTVIQSQLVNIEAAIKVRKKLEKEYSAYRAKEMQDADEARRNYDLQVADAHKSARLIETSYENKITGEIVYRQEYDGLQLPDYTYTPITESSTYLNTFLGNSETKLLFPPEALSGVTSAKQLFDMIDQYIVDANQVISQNKITLPQKSVNIAGKRIALPSAAMRNGNSFQFLIAIEHNFADQPNSSQLHPWKNIKLMVWNLTAEDFDTNIDPTFKFVLPNGTVKPYFFPTKTMTSYSTEFRDAANTPLYLADYNDEESVTFVATIPLIDGTLTLTGPLSIGFSRISNTHKQYGGNGVFVPKSNGGNEENPDGETTFIPSRYGIRNLGIADYRKVEQSICCYEPGEVAHIENIMAREYKEKATERSRVSDTTTTLSSEREAENLTDTTTATRNEMHSEVAQVLHEDSQLGLNAEVHYGLNKNYGGSINGSFAHNTSEDDSTSEAITYAQDVTERAMARVTARTKSEIVTKVVESYRETNKHGFDNTKGTEHVSGVYRWVNKVYNNQLVNYGKRAMIEFMIPEPAVFHILASAKDHDENNENKIPLPMDPRIQDEAGSNWIPTAKEVNKIATPENYLYWAAQFNIEIDDYPKEYISIGKSFTKSQAGGDGDNYKNKAVAEDIDIPEGYMLYSAYASWYYKDGDGGHAIVDVRIADKAATNGSVLQFDPLTKPFMNKVPVSASFNKVWVSNVNIELILVRTPEFHQSWKNSVFNAIISAYEDRLASFYAAEKVADDIEKEKNTYNSMFYRQIERNALKKNMMHYLVDDKFIGQDYILNDKDLEGLRPINNQAFDDNASVTRFMEQAFEWEIISYTFYPYYWGSSQRWKANYNYQYDDALFTNFMQAGMARVILTVRPGFEKAVNWYMATGQVWNGGQVPTLGDELFLSIDDEMKDTAPTPEGLPWKTVLPSDLTVIQSSTIGLDAEGLPCGCPTTVGGSVNLGANVKSTNTQIGGPITGPEKEQLVIKDGRLEILTANGEAVIASISMAAIKRELEL